MAAEKIKYVIPDTYKQALSSNESEKWKKAMIEEIQSMHDNNTWKLVPRAADVKPLACKWIYGIKEGNSSTDPPRFKARLVAKGLFYRDWVNPTQSHPTQSNLTQSHSTHPNLTQSHPISPNTT
ncbi:unnamed protein product [Rhodiola kirilowii]